ncbi:hypothetical protein Btru_012025 [Bulinus truncatus]|nr:hypothetical protein Btru_012025 [Bulinus truncatus]
MPLTCQTTKCGLEFKIEVSDSCYNGTSTDRSGENLKHLVESGKLIKGTVVTKDIIPDEQDQIKAKLLHWSDHLKLDLILTTGGTGFACRDVTPEATKAVLEKEALGLTVAMLKGSLEITPMAMLTRLVCGTRGGTLIINLPGSTKGSAECFQIASVAIPHAVDLLRGHKSSVEKTHSALHAEGIKTASGSLHSHPQLSTECQRNISKFHITPSASSKMTTGDSEFPASQALDTSKNILDQASSSNLLMWKALLSLPKEVQMSLMNTFSSASTSVPMNQLTTAQQGNTTPHLSSPSEVHCPTSRGHHFVNSIHSSLGSVNALPSNIQVVRPQIMAMNPGRCATGLSDSSSTATSSAHSQYHDNASVVSGLSPPTSSNVPSRMNSSQSHSTLPTSTQLWQKNRNHQLSTRWLQETQTHHSAGSNLLNSKHYGSASGAQKCPRTGVPVQTTCSGVGQTESLVSHDKVKSCPIPSLLAYTSSQSHNVSTSSPSPETSIRGSNSTHNALHSGYDSEGHSRSENISAREIKPVVHSSVNSVVQVFLPSSGHSNSNRTYTTDGGLFLNQQAQCLNMPEFRQANQRITTLDTVLSSPTHAQTFSDVSDDMEVSVEETGSYLNEKHGCQLLSEREIISHHIGHNNHGNPDMDNSPTHNHIGPKKLIVGDLKRESQQFTKTSAVEEIHSFDCQTSTGTWAKPSESMISSIKSAKIHYLKTKGELLYVPVGTSLKSFINEHPLVQGIYLHKGKREIKKQLAQLCRQCDVGDQMTSWRRGKEILERNRFDDYFDLTEEGKKEQEDVLASRKRDQYVVNWYVWCPGHSNCKRKCGGFGVCVDKCKGMMHKQDRHNCSLMINMKLFLSDLSAWRVNITGSHVPPGSGITWVPPVLYKLQSLCGQNKEESGSRTALKNSPSKALQKKTGPQGSPAPVGHSFPPALSLTNPSPAKLGRVVNQTAKASATIPSKKRISKMLSSLRRRMQERQSSLKNSAARRVESIIVPGDQDSGQLSSCDKSVSWCEGNSCTQASMVVQRDADHVFSASAKHLVPRNLKNIFDSFSEQMGSGIGIQKKCHDDAGGQTVGLVTPVTSLIPGDDVVSSHKLNADTNLDGIRHCDSDISVTCDLDQPYLNANTLCEILQQANSQDMFESQADSSSVAVSCHSDHLHSEPLKSSDVTGTDLSLHWSDAAALGGPTQSTFHISNKLSQVLPSSSMPAMIMSSTYESSPSQAYLKSESEAIASIVQSLCGASDYHTMQAIALHDPLLNPQYKDDLAINDLDNVNGMHLLESLPSYQEATASLAHQL